MDKRDCSSVVHICRNCGEDFDVTEQDGLADGVAVRCPDCGGDLVAVDFAAVRHGGTDRRRHGSAIRRWDAEPRPGEASGRAGR